MVFRFWPAVMRYQYFRRVICREKSGRVLKTLLLVFDPVSAMCLPLSRPGKALNLRQKLAHRLVIRANHELERPAVRLTRLGVAGSPPRLPNLNREMNYQDFVR